MKPNTRGIDNDAPPLFFASDQNQNAPSLVRRRLLEETTLGKELAAMKVQADALQGLRQIAYVPHLPGILSSGQGVFAMDKKMMMPSLNERDE